MTATAQITVGISTLNRPRELARCLDALLQGDVLPDEILIVDQGGDPQVRAFIDRQSRDTSVPVNYIRQTHRGLSASRNEVVRSATHGILAITDDDCVPDAGWLAAIKAAFATPPFPDAVTGRVLPLGPDEPGLYAVSLRTRTERRDFTSAALPWRVGTGANFAARTALLRDVGGYDERLGAGSPGRAAEDLELCHRLLQSGARIRYEPGAVVYHERQPKRRRMETRWSYGHGIGATCAMLWRRGDRHAFPFLRSWGRMVGRRLLKGAVRLDHDAVGQAWLSIRGTVRGFSYGWCVEREADRSPRPARARTP